MNEVISYILERLKEPSTWRGIIWLVTAVGFALSEEEKQAIATAGMTLVGLIGVFTKDNNNGIINETPSKEEIQTMLDDHAEKVEKIVKEKKNAKTKKPNPDNFFND